MLQRLTEMQECKKIVLPYNPVTLQSIKNR